MAKITNKELYEMIMEDREKINSIDEKLNRILDRIDGKVSENKGSSKDSKKSKKTSPSATKCTVTVKDGQGRGQGKKFIEIIFDGKPTEKTLKSLKEKGFTYYPPTKAWGSLLTDAKLEFANSLNK